MQHAFWASILRPGERKPLAIGDPASDTKMGANGRPLKKPLKQLEQFFSCVVDLASLVSKIHRRTITNQELKQKSTEIQHGLLQRHPRLPTNHDHGLYSQQIHPL
uniref:Uncharacterized protein n=1 Tax=Eutreptiella gymnastica TaxID=73025 RepID=A0A7S4G3R3_9EUGL